MSAEVIRYAITVAKPPEAVYGFWRDLKNFALISRHVKSVEDVGPNRTRWTVEGPNGDVSWTAEIKEDVPGRRIAWASTDDADVENSGMVEFVPAPAERGTEVYITALADVPGGFLGALWARVKGDNPEQSMADAMRRMKTLLECGEIPIVEGQPSSVVRDDPKTLQESRKVGLR